MALGDESEEMWAELEVALHMFDVYRLTQALRRRRHSVRRVLLAPVMRGRAAIQAAEMELLVDEFFEALEGGDLQQATLVSLVPPGGPRSELIGAALKAPTLRELRMDGWCWFDLKCGHLTALTSLVRRLGLQSVRVCAVARALLLVAACCCGLQLVSRWRQSLLCAASLPAAALTTCPPWQRRSWVPECART